MRTFVYLALITLSEATIGVFVKLTGNSVPIFSLNFYRVFFAFLFLLVTVPFIKRKFWDMDKDDIQPLIIIGLFIAMQISLFNLAMTLAPIANVVIFWSVAPIFVFIFSWIFLKEKPTKSHILIFIIALIGIFIAKPLEGGAMAGNIIALCSGMTYAALVTYMRYEGKDESPSMVVWYMGSASVILLPTLFIFGMGDLNQFTYYPSMALYLPTTLWVICLGILSTGIAYLFMSLVLQHISANLYSLVDIIVSPVVASIFGYLIFGEIPSENMIYGGILLLVSGYWLTSKMQGNRV